MLAVYVFSYNRPRFLDNCLESIQRHAPGAEVYVLDDDSPDPGVAKVLRRWTERRAVEVIPRGATALGLHGGLYNNMQRAFEHGANKGLDLGLFIQDDMQLNRDVTAEDLRDIEAYFAQTPNTIEMYVCFFKAMYHAQNRDQFVVDETRKAYFNKSAATSAPSSLCDVGVFHFGRMKDLRWSFEQGEGENNRKARGHALTIGYSLHPFMMYLPFPHTEYYRSKSLLLRAAEWWVGAGFHPYAPMSPERLKRLFARDPAELPEAELYLEAPGFDKPAPWIFGGAVIGMIEMGGLQGWIAGKAGRIIKTVNQCKSASRRLADALSRRPREN